MATRPALLLFCTAVLSWAQLYTGSVTGVVTDASGARVPGAAATLIDVDRDTQSKTKADGTGRYLFRSLPPGNYSVEVNAPPFTPFKLATVTLDVNATVTAA